MSELNPQVELDIIEKDSSKQKFARILFHQATPEHNVFKKKGKGYTRKDKSLPKSKLAIQKNSKKINRLKKRHHKTTKEKKSG